MAVAESQALHSFHVPAQSIGHTASEIDCKRFSISSKSEEAAAQEGGKGEERTGRSMFMSVLSFVHTGHHAETRIMLTINFDVIVRDRG